MTRILLFPNTFFSEQNPTGNRSSKKSATALRYEGLTSNGTIFYPP